MKILIALLFSILALCFTVRADTLQFTLTDTNTDQTVNFQLQQKQAPDSLTVCGCESSIDHGYASGEYFNVPLTVNGKAQTGTVSLFGPNFSTGPMMAIDHINFLGSIFTGSLEKPRFDLGTLNSLIFCSGFEMPTCGSQNPQSAGITLKISDTPEPSSLAMLLMGIPVLWVASRRITAKQSLR